MDAKTAIRNKVTDILCKRFANLMSKELCPASHDVAGWDCWCEASDADERRQGCWRNFFNIEVGWGPLYNFLDEVLPKEESEGDG